MGAKGEGVRRGDGVTHILPLCMIRMIKKKRLLMDTYVAHTWTHRGPVYGELVGKYDRLRLQAIENVVKPKGNCIIVECGMHAPVELFETVGHPGAVVGAWLLESTPHTIV